MQIEVVEEKIKEALELDDPTIIENLIKSENESFSFKELMGDDYVIAGDLIGNCIKQKKPKLFNFLKSNFPESSGWLRQLQLIQVEHHQVKDYLSGETDCCNVSELFEVQEGNLVVNKAKLEEASICVAFDRIGSYSSTAQNGGYQTEIYLADDEEIVSDMDRNMSPRGSD